MRMALGRRGLAMAVVLASLPLAAPAQQRTPTSGTKPAQAWWKRPKTASELKLTAEQQQAIEAAEQSYKDARATAMREYTGAYGAFVAELTSGKAASPALEARRSEFLAAWGALGSAHADRLAALSRILSTEQLETLVKVAPGVLRAGPIAVRAVGTLMPTTSAPPP